MLVQLACNAVCHVLVVANGLLTLRQGLLCEAKSYWLPPEFAECDVIHAAYFGTPNGAVYGCCWCMLRGAFIGLLVSCEVKHGHHPGQQVVRLLCTACVPSVTVIACMHVHHSNAVCMGYWGHQTSPRLQSAGLHGLRMQLSVLVYPAYYCLPAALHGTMQDVGLPPCLSVSYDAGRRHVSFA